MSGAGIRDIAVAKGVGPQKKSEKQTGSPSRGPSASVRVREARTHQVILDTDDCRAAEVSMGLGDNISVEVSKGGCLFGNDRAEYWIVLRSESGNDVIVGDIQRAVVKGRLVKHGREGGYDPYRFGFEPPEAGQYVIVAELGCRGGGGRQIVIDVRVENA